MKRLTMNLALSLSLVTVGLTTAHGQVIDVTPANMEGWSFGSFNADTDAFPGSPTDVTELVNGPGTPPLGAGSAELATGAGEGQDGVFLTSSVLDGVSLASLTSLSYSSYVTSNNGQQFPFIKLSISTQGNGIVDDSLFFEPPYQSGASSNPSLLVQETPALNTWQSWNVLAGGFYDGNGTFGSPGAYESPSTPGVLSLAAFLALYPNATIETDASSGYDSLRITAGETDPADTFTTYIEDVSLAYKNTDGGTTDITYEFDVSEPSTYLLMFAPLIFLGVLRRGSLSAGTQTEN